MPKAAKAKSRARSQPLYFSAKISDYQFRKVLWHFVLDHSAQEAARHINLRANSISAIFTKLRVFFFDLGVFTDIYNGGDPREGTGFEGEERYEFELLDFHLKRRTAKRGQVDCPMDEPDYHFAESHWRFGFVDLIEGRDPETAHHMMYGHLLELIRCCGPIGAPSKNRLDGKRLMLRHIDQRALWLERNSARYRSHEQREFLRSITGA